MASRLTQYYALLIYTVEVAMLVSWLGFGRRWREIVRMLTISGVSVAPIALWLAVTLRLLIPSSTPALTTAWAEQIAGWAAEPFTSVVFGQSHDTRRGLLLVSAILAVAGIGLLIGFLRRLWDARRTRSATGAGAFARGVAALVTGVVATGIAVVESLVLWPTRVHGAVPTLARRGWCVHRDDSLRDDDPEPHAGDATRRQRSVAGSVIDRGQ